MNIQIVTVKRQKHQKFSSAKPNICNKNTQLYKVVHTNTE